MQTLHGAVTSKSWLKVALGIAAIKWVRQFVPPAPLHLFYKALIQPHFDGCSVVWGSCGVKLAYKLKKLQNRAARALTFSSYDTGASHLFQNLNWKNLSTQRDIQKALMVFESLNDLAPEHLTSKVIARSHTTSYTPWDSVNKLTIHSHTNYLRNSFRYGGAVLWNSLPETLREAESLRNFKSLLHIYFNCK